MLPVKDAPALEPAGGLAGEELEGVTDAATEDELPAGATTEEETDDAEVTVASASNVAAHTPALVLRNPILLFM